MHDQARRYIQSTAVDQLFSALAAGPADTCTLHANQLSKSIDASLSVGDTVERDAFLQGVGALGFAPCQFIP